VVIVTFLLDHSFLAPTINLLYLVEYLIDKAIGNPSTSPIIVLDLLEVVDHKTPVDVMKVVVDVMKAPRFSLVMQSHALPTWFVTVSQTSRSELTTSLALRKIRSSEGGFVELPGLQILAFVPLPGIFRNYLNTIFENWSSESAVPGGPSPLDRTATEARIEVGTLKVNTPPSKMQVRKANPAQKPARPAGQPVFCGITLN
jgi:hypothetical protein